MLFNSLAFLIFFPLVVVLYWLLPFRYRNIFLLIASYYFYMNWEPIYALLILFSTIVTWVAAKYIESIAKHKKTFLILSLVINLAILGIYKYAGFFNTVVHDLMGVLGIAIEIPQFTLLLPVGISFYTFQAIGYTIDVYRGTIKAERSFLTYALFVSFFPQLVAGPIERAKNLLPQFKDKHYFSSEKFIDGLQMMLWGYFMKLCIAENIASYVDAVFNNLHLHNGTSIWLASFFFTFQIFCDFGGYSLIAIGCAKCIGFNLMDNFKQPYLATSIRSFWRRWHISLTTWFTDYVYIPLGGNRCSKIKHKRNLLCTFLLSGLWHGANYTFIAWGGYHGLLLVGQSVIKDWNDKYTKLPTAESNPLLKALSIFCTFILALIGWVFFRANSLDDATFALKSMFTNPGPLFYGAGKPALVLPIILIIVLMIREYINERNDNKVVRSERSMSAKIAITALLLITILLCGSFEGGQFIYFQF